MQTDQTISRSVRLSARLSIDLTFGSAGMVCEWNPEPMEMTKLETERYYAARNSCASEFARLLGGSVVMGDLAANGRGVTGLLCFRPDGRVERL